MWIEEELVGKRIIGFKVKSPSVWIEVQGGGWVEINIEGDCCSTAFVDAVRIIDRPILTGERSEISFGAEPTEQECDEITAVQFNSDARGGAVVVVHRNSSNGYYGNYMSVNSHGEPPADAINCKTDWFRSIKQKG